MKFINNYTGSVSKNYKIAPVKITVNKQSGFATKNVKLSWGKVTGATGYEIYCSTKKNGKYSKVVKLNSKKNTYKHKKLKLGKKYYYKIRAYKIDGKHYIPGEFSNILTTITKPVATKVRLTTSKNQVVVSYSKVNGAKGYEVYMATSRNGKYTKIATNNATKTKITKSKLSSGKTYYFKARAYSESEKGLKVYGRYSTVKSIKVK